MRALRLTSFGAPLVEEALADPRPGPGEVVVRVRAAGVCHSDAHYRGGRGTVPRLPLTLGHEIAGVVAAAGDGVAMPHVGDRVAVHYLVACGRYRGCGRSEQFCETGEMVGKDRSGGQAELVLVPARNAVPIPEGVEDAAAAIAMCSTSTAYHALRLAELRPREIVMILGFGGLGVSVLQLAKAMGALRVYAVDVNEDKLAAARALGAVPIDGRRELGITDADVAIDLVGHPPLCTAALRALAPGGRLMLVGLNPKPFDFNPYRDVLARERRIVGCSDHTREEVVELLAMLADGRLDLAPAISRRIPFGAAEVNAALDDLERGTGHFRTVVQI